MLRNLALILAVLCVPTLVSADDIKLKSGEVIKDCKVLKKGKTTWKIELLNGRRRTIKAADVAEYIEKSTPADEFDEKLKALGKRDIAGMIALGRWGLEKGIKKKATKLVAKVLRLDKENKEAHELLGHELCEDGKWRYGKKLAKYKAAKRAEELAALGWVKVKGEWYDPHSARCVRAGMVKGKDGKWYSKKALAEISKGRFFFEGVWYDRDDRAKIDEGFRKVKGKWKALADLDAKHRDPKTPWIIESEHFVIESSLKYKTLRAYLDQFELDYAALADLCGDAPAMPDKDSKIHMFVVKDNPTYRAKVGAFQGDDRSQYYSSSHGAFYAPKRGAILGYYHTKEYTFQWLQQALAQAFLYRVAQDRPASNMFDLVSSYVEGFFGGKYHPVNSIAWNALRDWDPPAPRKVVTEFRVDAEGLNAVDNEARFGHLGFVFHYLVSKYPKIVRREMRHYLLGRGGVNELFDACEEAAGNDMAEDFKKAAKEYYRNYKQPHFGS